MSPIPTPVIVVLLSVLPVVQVGVVPPAGPTTINEAAHLQFVFAYRLLKKGEVVLAAEAFDEYLEKFSNDIKHGDACYFRAMLAHQSGQYDRAAKLLEHVPATVFVPPFATDLLRGQIWADLHQYEAALRALEKISLESLGPMTKASVLYLRGRAYRGAKNLPAAAEALAAAAAVDSTFRARATLDLARTQIQMDQSGKAIDTIRRCLALEQPKVAAEAARIGGDLSYKGKQYDQAADFYRIVITSHQISPHFAAAIDGLLWSYYQGGMYEMMLQTFNMYKESIPDQHRFTAWYLGASAHQELGEHGPALALLQSILFTAAGTLIQDKVLYKMAASQFELGHLDAMESTMAQLRRVRPNSPLNDNALLLLAAADSASDKPARGIARLSPLLDQSTDAGVVRQALWQRAVLYEQNEQVEQAVQDYERFLTASDSPQRLIHARLRLIDLHYRLARFEQSEIYANQLLDQPDLDPESEQEALYRRALALNKLERREPALEAIDTLIQKHPTTPYLHGAHYYRGLLLILFEKPDEAVTSLLVAARGESLDEPLRTNALRLAALHLREKNDRPAAADAMLRLERIVGTDGLHSDERLWLGRYLVEDVGEPRQGLARLRSLFGDVPQLPTSTRVAALLLGGRALRSLEDHDAAARAFGQVIALGADSVLTARIELARTLAAAGKVDEALAQYSLLINAEPKFAAKALFESARIHRDRAIHRRRVADLAGAEQDQQQARRLLKRLVLLYPDQTPLAELSHIALAQIATERGDAASATSEWADLAANYPDTVYAIYARSMRALEQQKRGEAKFLLGKLRVQSLDDQLSTLVLQQLQVLETSP